MGGFWVCLVCGGDRRVVSKGTEVGKSSNPPYFVSFVMRCLEGKEKSERKKRKEDESVKERQSEA